MSWHFSRALVAEYSAACCSDGAPSALSRSTPTPAAFYWPDKTTGHSRLSRFGMTSEPLTEPNGAALLTWFLAGFPAKPIPRRLEAARRRMTSGRKCGESWQMSLLGTLLPRTRRELRSMARATTLRRWVTRRAPLPLPRATWVQTMFGSDIGYVHTPTTMANYAAPSMQKWPACRAFVRVFGTPAPTNHEWLMGWPTGWTDLSPLETDRFQSWQQQHGGCSPMSERRMTDPATICADCGARLGRCPDGHVASWWQDTCDYCGRETSVTEPRDYGWPERREE